MKGSECRLIEYMEGSKKRYLIPVYQRNYDWKTENCKQLYDDLVKVVKNNRNSHFFGSIVSVYTPSGRNTEYLVIDGQQRLTTVSLLFLAMYNLLEKGIMVTEDPSVGKQIYEDFLVDKFQPEETRIKLKPVKNDKNAFSKLFHNENEYVKDSNVTINYEYFYNRIQKEEVSIEELYDAICRLEIINIVLTNDDDPQLIFESLNSTGLDLSEGDKIRNFILMGLPAKKQNEYYENYWNPIEILTNYDVSSFIRDYLSIKRQAIPSQKKVYVNFKEYVELKNMDIVVLLDELKQYAKRYEYLLKGNTSKKSLNECISRLNRLETTVTRPFFMEVFRMYDEGYLDIDQVTEIFLTTENYLFRRSICDLPTNTLNKIFLMLHNEIVRYDKNNENYVEKFKFALINKKEKARFPSDMEFIEAFSERQVYMMHSKNKLYILERFENFGTKEDKDVYSHCDSGVYSIEHIMPQHLRSDWKKELGENYESIHETWLHRIANLTLTAYNSQYSNYSFQEKKSMKNGFEDSGIRMNTWIAKKDKWTLDELEERNSYLMSRALEIWIYPGTNYKPTEKQLDSYTLDDSDLLTGRSIVKFAFKGTEQNVKTWKEMYQSVLQILYVQDKSIIIKLANSKEDGLPLQFTTNEKEYSKVIEIGDGIYVYANTSTQNKLYNLEKVFNLYNESTEELVFYLNDDNGLTNTSDRKEKCYQYWQQAIESIKQENVNFQNVNPVKENWISGSFGVSGIVINCVITNKKARVEIWFGKSKKELNKSAYDYLYARKKEIEDKLNKTLYWDRNDDVKASKIYLELNDVGLNDQETWEKVKEFHVKWSSNFYNVIVPYIKEWDKTKDN